MEDKWFNFNEDQKLNRIERAVELLPDSLLRDNVVSILKQYKQEKTEGAIETLRFLMLEEVNLHWKDDKSKKEMLEVLCDGLAR